MMDLLIGFIGFVVIGWAYLFPTYIALVREHNSAGAICALNLLLGWSGLGWIIALIWSFTGNVRRVA